LCCLFFFFWPLCCLFPGTPRVPSTTKTGRHDIAEILLKVALKHQTKFKFEYKHTCIINDTMNTRIVTTDVNVGTDTILVTLLLLLAIVLSVLLRYTDFDYPFGIF
jgi:hypothetical protein